MRSSMIAGPVLLALALGGSACGGSPGGGESPEVVVRALIDAARAGDVDKARSLLPSDELLARAFDCPAGRELGARFERARAGLAQELPELAGLTLRAREPAGDHVERVAVGQDFQGCRALVPLELLKARVVFEAKDGRPEPDTLRFILVDGRAYLVTL